MSTMREQLSQLMYDFTFPDVEMDRWDVVPSVWFLFQELDEDGGDAKLRIVHLPDEGVWNNANPVDVLEYLILPKFRVAGPMPLPHNASLYGMLFFSEGWALIQNVGNPDEVEDAKKAAREHTIHEHPDRREVKMLSVSLSEGLEHVGLTWERGQEKPETEGVHMEGRVFDCLDAIVETLTKEKSDAQ